MTESPGAAASPPRRGAAAAAPLRRVIVCGGRRLTDPAIVWPCLDRLPWRPALVIHGAAPGADSLAARWSFARGVPVLPMPADWPRYGRRAGPIRNRAMLALHPALVVAFPGGAGTADMLAQARAAGVPILPWLG